MPHLSFFLSFFDYIAWFFVNDVMEHFVFPGKFMIGDESRATSVQMTQNSKRKTLLESWPARIFHRNSSGERRLNFIASGKDDENKKARSRESISSTAKATSSTLQPQHVQRQRQNTAITLQMKPMKKGDTDCRRLKKP